MLTNSALKHKSLAEAKFCVIGLNCELKDEGGQKHVPELCFDAFKDLDSGMLYTRHECRYLFTVICTT